MGAGSKAWALWDLKHALEAPVAVVADAHHVSPPAVGPESKDANVVCVALARCVAVAVDVLAAWANEVDEQCRFALAAVRDHAPQLVARHPCDFHVHIDRRPRVADRRGTKMRRAQVRRSRSSEGLRLVT